MISFSRERKINISVTNTLLFFVFSALTGAAFFITQSLTNYFTASLNVDASYIAGPTSVAKPITAGEASLSPYSRPGDLTINAKAGIIIETGLGAEKVLFQKNTAEKMPVASLAKLMTAAIVLKNYNVLEKVTVDEGAMAQEGVQGVLKLGETLSVKDLLYITLMESSNRAAYALSEVMGAEKFVSLMNEKAREIGLSSTHFEDSTGLSPKSYSTAEDIAKLSEYVFETYPLFREIISLKEFDLYLDNGQFHHKLINTNKLLAGTPGVIGGKTGWTDEAKGCFMLLQESQKKGTYLIYIVLGAEDRFLEMKKMINWTNATYHQ